MDTKTALASFAIIVILAVGGYFGWQALSRDSSTTTTENSGTQENNLTQEKTPVTQQEPQAATDPNATAPTAPVVRFETTEGSFKVTLDGVAAPQTVQNFIKLANEGFYDGLNFHRIVDGFMIQGGDPAGDGTGGPGYTVPAEIKLKHTKGAISMARQGDQVNPTKASSGSQFFITLEDTPFLDGQYTAFGYVTEGLNVVEKIGKTPTEPNPMTGEQSLPLKEIKINKVVVESM